MLYRFYRGENLDELGEQALAVATMLARNEGAVNALYAALVLRAIGDARGSSADRQRFERGSWADAELLQQIGANQTARGTYHALRAAGAFLAGDYRRSLAEASQAAPLLPYFASQLAAVEHVFYRALAAAGVLRAADGGEAERATLLETLRQDEATLRGWAADCPYNHEHRHALVAAELATASAAFDAALDLYERAIRLAREHGFIHHQALANELCGLFHRSRGRAKLARSYLIEAHEVYLHWGGSAIAKALAARHPSMLENVAANALPHSTAIAPRTATDVHGQHSGSFDLIAAMRASQAIASELDPDRLIERVMRILIANAGAQRGLLIAVRGERLEIAAALTIEPDEMRLRLAEDVHASAELATSVVQYVARTCEIVVLGDAASDARFGDDPHVVRTQAKSLLCLPMSHQGRLAGILYLGNDLTTDAFSPQRVELLQFLAAQATVAMENAKLYAELHTANETLERRVAARTRELADSHEQYRVLLETTEAIPWEMEPATLRFSYVGPQAGKLLGYSAQDWTHAGFLAERLVPESRAQVLERLRVSAERDGHDEIDLCMIAADGRPVWMRTLVTTTHDALFRPVRRGILLDVTEQRRLEIELRAAQKLESVGRLASGIAHEVNTPVQFVSDNVQFVSEAFADLKALLATYQSLATYSASAGEPDFATRVAAVRAMEEAIDLAYMLENVPDALARSLDGLGRIATIVRSMKLFSHPDLTQKSQADLNANIQATLVIAAHEYKLVATLHTDFGELPPVVCHAGEINQVILNLIVNAAHAINDNVAATHGLGKITVRTWQEGNEVVFSVADSGGGVPERVRDKIFDPFFTTKEVGRGTGQGLAIARAVVVEKHGGQISFETELGKGTTFFVRLPIVAAA